MSRFSSRTNPGFGVFDPDSFDAFDFTLRGEHEAHADHLDAALGEIGADIAVPPEQHA